MRITNGEELIHAYEPPDGFAKLFCSSCGSALFSRNPEDPGLMSVRLGAIDGDPGLRPAYRQHLDSAAAWEAVPDDGLPHYPDRRPPTVA